MPKFVPTSPNTPKIVGIAPKPDKLWALPQDQATSSYLRDQRKVSLLCTQSQCVSRSQETVSLPSLDSRSILDDRVAGSFVEQRIFKPE